MDFGYAFDFLIWNHELYEEDVPQYRRLISNYIARAIYDGTLLHRYLTDAEVSNSQDSESEE